MPKEKHCNTSARRKNLLWATKWVYAFRELNKMPSDLLNAMWSERPVAPLYHYTSPAGLLGIIETKSLWASGIQYLNDTAEYKHMALILQDLLKRRLEKEQGPWNDLYRLLLRGESVYLDKTVFVSSLSEAKDLLSQWRAYCPTGGGFSIGFDHKLIMRQAKKQNFCLLKCEYDATNQKAICDELISDGCRAADEAVTTYSKSAAPHKYGKKSIQTVGLWHRIIEPSIRFAPALKNPSFQEEREWRLVRNPFDTPDSQVRFRPSKYAVIPYREFSLADKNRPLHFEEIIIGPNPDPIQARKSVEYLLEAKGVRCKRISDYSGTYRNW
jgi:hypothetical protein